jgi:endonuclease/exonuclease/phosphatase family metal-dependent hydrolase
MKTNETENNAAPRAAWHANSTTLCPMLRLLLVAVLLSPALTLLGGAVDVGGKRHVDTMTINLYLGSGTGRILALNPTDPGYLNNLVATVTGIHREVLASQPPVRLQGVADEIVSRLPDIVAVEEASLIRTESPGDLAFGGRNPATQVVFDYLQILVDALAARGARYAVVSTANELDVELPMFNLQTGAIDDVRLTDRDAILVRTDLPPGQFRVSNAQHGNFRNVVQISSIGLSVLRGWCSVDVFMRGEQFRYICTHLEEETVPQIQLLQAEELLSGPAQVNLPVILAGDLNADILHRNGTQTYDTLIAAGFKDAWTALHPADPAGGLTWGHDEFLADPDAAPLWRIDLVLFRGTRFVATHAESIDIGLDRTQPPLWASDHAAVAAQVQFQPSPKRLR